MKWCHDRLMWWCQSLYCPLKDTEKVFSVTNILSILQVTNLGSALKTLHPDEQSQPSVISRQLQVWLLFLDHFPQETFPASSVISVSDLHIFYFSLTELSVAESTVVRSVLYRILGKWYRWKFLCEIKIYCNIRSAKVCLRARMTIYYIKGSYFNNFQWIAVLCKIFQGNLLKMEMERVFQHTRQKHPECKEGTKEEIIGTADDMWPCEYRVSIANNDTNTFNL